MRLVGAFCIVVSCGLVAIALAITGSDGPAIGCALTGVLGVLAWLWGTR